MYCYWNEVIAENNIHKIYASFRSESFADVNDNKIERMINTNSENMTQDIVEILHIMNTSVLMDLEYLVYVYSCAVGWHTNEGTKN